MKHILKNFIILVVILFFVILIFKRFNFEEKIYKFFYPKKYEEYVEKYSAEENIDPILIYSIIKAESNFNEEIESNMGAIGLMQLMEETAKEQSRKLGIEYKKENLYNPEYNIRMGTKYFSSLLKTFNNNYLLAFAAYNAGIGNVQKWIENGTIKEDGSNIENIPFKETNMYVRKIIRNYKIYKDIYEK